MKISAIIAVLLLIALPAKADHLRLVFTGDIMAHEEQLKAAHFEEGYNFSGQFANVLPLLKGDVLIGNFETVLGGERFGYTGYPSFNAPDALADNLKDAGFHVLTLANNHILDKGPEAALRTRDVLTQKGFVVSGVYRADEERLPVLLNVKGAKLGILNYTYGSNTWWPEARMETLHLNRINLEAIGRDLAWLRTQQADIIVALFHWGVEYQFQPSAAQRQVAAFCLSQGVDMVVGTHPHILQPMEVVRTGPQTQFVAWSLGNFVSYQRTLPRERSAILAVDFNNKNGVWKLTRAAAAPTWVQNTVEDGRRYLRILGTSAPGNSPVAETLALVGKNVRHTLGLAEQTDFFGFHSVWQAEPTPDKAKRLATSKALRDRWQKNWQHRLEAFRQWRLSYTIASAALEGSRFPLAFGAN